MGILRYIDRLKVSGPELAALGVAWFILILAFVPQALIGGLLLLTGRSALLDPEVVIQASIMAFALGAAFIFHEMGHKFAAQKFRAKAEFQLDQRGLIYTVVSIALGFYLLMPGAVFWESELAKYDNIRGRVAAAGPIVNLLLASLSLGFIALGLDAPPFSIGWLLFKFGQISFYLNVYLGIFNMIPLWILDGKKVLAWNEGVWFAMIMMFISLIIAAYLAINFHFFFFFISFPP